MLNTEEIQRVDKWLAQIRETLVNGNTVSGGGSIETENVRVEIRFEPVEAAAL